MTPPPNGLRRAFLAALALLAAGVWAVWVWRVRARTPRLADGAPGVMRVVFLDVGYGDAAWVHTPRGTDVLIDAGPGASGALREHGQTLVFSTANAPAPLGERLRARGVTRVESVVISHSHYDHWGGLPSLWEAGIVVGAVYESSMAALDDAYLGLLSELDRRGIPVRSAAPGDMIPTGDPDVALDVLGPRREHAGAEAGAANRSLLVKLAHGAVSVLFPGDAQVEAELDALEAGDRLSAAVLKVSDHGGGHASTAPFLDWVRPRAAVVSVDTPNVFGAPQADALQKFIDRGVDYYRTDLDGEVTLLSDGKEWTIASER